MAAFTYKVQTRLKAIFAEMSDDIARGATAAANDCTNGLKKELREQVEAAGLGTRLANTWRGNTYPLERASISPATYVWSKAPNIVDAFDRAPVIRTVNGRRFLAIPTENVPRVGGRRGSSRKMTPAEVETAFNQDLKFEKTKKGSIIAYVDAVAANSGTGYRRPSKKRVAQGRTVQAVIMFILVPFARMPKRLSIDAAALYWANQVPRLLENRLGN